MEAFGDAREHFRGEAARAPPTRQPLDQPLVGLPAECDDATGHRDDDLGLIELLLCFLDERACACAGVWLLPSRYDDALREQAARRATE
jgi:hypothetical protein